ncbi:addiction module toxin, HicA family [Weissella cibaria]|nr:addiction module toxin, HicA family [Weissella cibaria]
MRQIGSHKQFKNADNGRMVTVPYHYGGRELPKGLEKAILKQAGLN